jgi:hypothetical protein
VGKLAVAECQVKQSKKETINLITPWREGRGLAKKMSAFVFFLTKNAIVIPLLLNLDTR